ncbi:hypothetical protein ACIBKY_03655 [Nonomuraea sp. NPDC050394]|uniref:hypothetical protein n=1 Tax=Nonomuraea sp. NPDC050394 TaxID=3364363 RepID=UPI00378F7686
MPNWYSQHRFNQIPPTGLVLPSSSTEPNSPVAFELWASPASGKAFWRTPGGTWMALDDVADGTITNAKVAANAAISLSKLATNPLDRAQHTGTQPAATIADFVTQVRANRLDQLAAPGADIALAGYRLTNLGAPVNANDAARLADVHAAAAGISVKPAVRVATTATITLSGLQTIDGVSVQAGDRVLVKNQTTTTQNGLYTAASGAWTRTTDALNPNTFVFVSEGTSLAETGWAISTNGAIVVGTTAIAWAQFAGGGGGGGAGAGLVQNGGNTDIVAADGSIIVQPDSISVGLVPIGKGGTGATTATAARTALGIGGSFSADLPALTPGAWHNVTHSLGSLDVAEPSFREVATGEFVEMDSKVIDANTVAVRSALAVTAATIRIKVTS